MSFCQQAGLGPSVRNTPYAFGGHRVTIDDQQQAWQVLIVEAPVSQGDTRCGCHDAESSGSSEICSIMKAGRKILFLE